MDQRVSFSYKTLTLGLVAMLLVALLGTFAGGVLLAPHLSGVAQAAQTSADDANVLAAYERALSEVYNKYDRSFNGKYSGHAKSGGANSNASSVWL